ncbi:MAG: hypothetical protein KAK01_02615 [Candidatus Marinimicrobia bacterium]|nr:hypothetical protein [Candidatus Neomarinimicrobiota bacterium]
MVLAEDNEPQVSNSTIFIKTKEQINTGETLTLVAQVTDNEYDEPVLGGRVNFFVKTDFFIDSLVEIGVGVTDEKGLAMIDYIPNQPGELEIVASYKASSNLQPVVAESMVIVSGKTKSIYQTIIGIQFPNSIIVWMIVMAIITIAIWGIFLYVIYNVLVVHISRGNGAKSISIIFMVSATILLIVFLLVLFTPEAQYNFGLLP